MQKHCTLDREDLPIPGFLIQATAYVLRGDELSARLPSHVRDILTPHPLQSEAGNASMSRTELRALLDAVGQVQDPQGLGLLIGERITEPNMHAFGPMIVASCTIREAFERCDALLQDTRLAARGRLEVGEREIRYEIADRRLGPVWEDLLMSLAFHLARRFVESALPPGKSPSELFTAHFPRPAPADLEPYLRCFGSVPRFGAESTYITFPRSLLDLPRPGTDPAFAAELQQVARRRLRPLKASHPWTAQLEAALSERENLARVDFHRLAQCWGLSYRTLRRYLSAENESTSRILERVRFDRARHYLTETDASLADIAEALGYADVTGMRRAFKRWTGLSPQAYRDQQRDA